MRILIALGGNAMTSPEGHARPEDQRKAISVAMEKVAKVVSQGHEVLLTHGNGPQVGNLLVKNELAAQVVPPVSLDWCGAQTQGTIGFMIINALEQSLHSLGIDRKCAAIITRTQVDPLDSRFQNPTKPIGRYVDEHQAQLMIEHGQIWQDRGEKGWRRMVASPEPLHILERDIIDLLLKQQVIVVAAGGGGIPVAVDENQKVNGVEAVIDKDLTASLLAAQLRCELLVIATDVSHAMVHWGSKNERAIGLIEVSEMRALAPEFGSGSMSPKVEAACRFAESGGTSIVTSLENIDESIDAIVSGKDPSKFATVVNSKNKEKK